MATNTDNLDGALDPGEASEEISATSAEVSNNEAENRFELHIGGRMAFLTYRRTAHQIALTHSETPREMEGRGLGSRVVRAALEFAREHGLKVVPSCPFVAWYISQHREYADLVRPD